MRKAIIGLALLAAAGAADTLLVQDFDTTWNALNPPDSWVIIHGDTFSRNHDWHRVAAGTPPWSTHPTPYAAIYWDPPLDSTPDILMSRVINAGNYRNVVLTCSTYFRGKTSTAYTAQIRFSTDGGTTFPFLIRNYYLQNVGPNVQEVLALGRYASRQSNLVIAWTFSGDLYDINWWFVDDVAVTGDSILQYDVRCQAILDPGQREQPGNLNPTIRFRNVGSVDQYDVPIFCELYDSLGGTLLQAWADTIDTILAFDSEKDTFFDPPYALTPGNYYIRFWHTAPDSNPGNDTLDLDFICSTLEELRNDDGGVAGYVTWPVSHYGWSARFTAPGSFFLESLLVYLSCPAPLRNRRYQLAIAKDSAGVPGEFLFKTPVLYGAAGSRWNSTYVGLAGDEIVPGGTFHVVYLQCGEPPECPGLGQDGNLDSTTAYREYRAGTYAAATPPGDLMVRVLINRQALAPAQFDIRTTFVEDPLFEVVQRPYNQPVSIVARLQNWGTDILTNVQVACTVASSIGLPIYTASATVASLDPGAEQSVSFTPSWVPLWADGCTIVVNTGTDLSQPDGYPNNNAKRFPCDLLKGAHTGRSTNGLAWIDSDTLDGPVYSWIDPDTDKVLISTGPDARIYAPIGFAFPFDDTSYQNAYVCDNGWFNLGYDPGTSATGPDTIPNTASPNTAFYGWWRDLGFGPFYGGGKVYWRNVGTAPNRQYVITWRNANVMGTDTSDKVTFQAVLNENGTVVFQYQDVECGDLEYDNGRNASIGFEDAVGTEGVNYLYSVPPLATGRNGLVNRVRSGLAVKLYRELRDAAANYIPVPEAYVFPETLYPQGTVQNYGTIRDTIRVFMIISPGSYYDTLTIADLAPGAETTVTFSTGWYADSGTYVAVCSTAMTGDENPSNNAFSRVFTVSPWVQRPDIPLAWTRRKVKNAALAYAPTTGKLYALKGSNTNEMWCYDITSRTWDSLASMPMTPSYTRAKDGCDLAFDRFHGNQGSLWAIKGGGRTDFYVYDIATNVWRETTSITAPAGQFRAPKKGAAIVHVPTRGAQGSIYCIPGNNTRFFYRYDIDSSRWSTCPTVPIKTVNPKSCKFGSDLVYDGMSTVYLLKGTNTTEVWQYAALSDTWGPMLDDVSLLGPRRRRVKSGGTITYFDNRLFVLKGGNTQEFWSYDFNGNDSWRQRTDIPISAVGRRTKVKRGAALCATDAAIFALKGSYCVEFWEYRPGTDRRPLLGLESGPARAGVMAGQTDRKGPWLDVGANPARGALRLDYNLGRGGATRLSIYDAGGRLVRTLVDAALPPGRHRAVWDGRAGSGRAVAAGVYFARLETGDVLLARKLVLQR